MGGDCICGLISNNREREREQLSSQWFKLGANIGWPVWTRVPTGAPSFDRDWHVGCALWLLTRLLSSNYWCLVDVTCFHFFYIFLIFVCVYSYFSCDNKRLSCDTKYNSNQNVFEFYNRKNNRDVDIIIIVTYCYASLNAFETLVKYWRFFFNLNTLTLKSLMYQKNIYVCTNVTTIIINVHKSGIFMQITNNRRNRFLFRKIEWIIDVNN